MANPVWDEVDVDFNLQVQRTIDLWHRNKQLVDGMPVDKASEAVAHELRNVHKPIIHMRCSSEDAAIAMIVAYSFVRGVK